MIGDESAVDCGNPGHRRSGGVDAQAPETRASVIARAQVWSPTDVASMDVFRGPAEPGRLAFGEEVRCQFLDEALNGRSPKFACVTPSGDELKSSTVNQTATR